MTVQNRIPKGWLPADLKTNSPSVTWMEFGSVPLAQPFFEDTVVKLRHGFPPAKEMNTDMEAILATANELSTVTPAGLIFHVSRCGSTLMSNALRLAENTIVVSEADPITKLFVPYAPSTVAYPLDQWVPLRAKLLESLATIFAHYRTGRKERLIIKFTSWNIISWRVIRSIWPDVPCLVLTRDPIEVMISNLSSGWMKLKTYLLDSGEPVTQMDEVEYCARIIGKLCESGVELCDDNCRVLDYEHINAATIRGVAGFFGTQLPDGDRLDRLLRVDAKDPRQRRSFKEDRQQKQQSATESMRQAVRQWASEPYAQLRARESWRSTDCECTAVS